MNKSESKYFATAARMDEAFLSLLGKKDFEFITVKEICEAAGVNRSTFYLHYETVGDLLSESLQYMYDRFLAHMKENSIGSGIVSEFHDCPPEKLYLVTPEYLKPYLLYIAENKRLFRTAMKNASPLRLDETYEKLLRHVFTPILERFHVPECDRAYLMAFYIHGLMAIVNEWLNQNCADSIDHIVSVMQQCVISGCGTEKTE